MKLFENSSKSEDNQKELETAQLRAQLEQERLEFEKAKQESLEKKLDELILVGKAVYTILKQEREDRQAAYERLENQIQEATSELISTQEKAVKVMIAYNRDNSQNMTSAINEELVKVQRVTAVAQKHLLAAAEELNNSISDNTSILGNKLSALENSISNMNISVAAAPTVTDAVTAYVPAEDIFAVVDDEEEVPIEEDIMSVLEEEELEVPEPEFEEASEETPEEDIFTVADDEEEVPIEEDIMSVLEEDVEIEEPAPIIVEAPIIDDPNRAMTPDEIAALIASVGGGSSEVEEAPVPEIEEELVISEPELEEEPEPIVVEAPVIDDPNRAMTPDEIAALIASMN